MSKPRYKCKCYGISSVGPGKFIATIQRLENHERLGPPKDLTMTDAMKVKEALELAVAVMEVATPSQALSIAINMGRKALAAPSPAARVNHSSRFGDYHSFSHTSLVLSFDIQKKEIETLNSIYYWE
jgi:hypothetical protein